MSDVTAPPLPPDQPNSDPVQLIQDIINLMEGHDPYRELDAHMRRRCMEAVYRLAGQTLPPIPSDPEKDKLAWAYFNEPAVQAHMRGGGTYADIIDYLARELHNKHEQIRKIYETRPLPFVIERFPNG
ncbi:MAG: hypothetical protein WC869_01330 [Phycisphaerae bacterium]|jgi:hypothetical protein